MKKTVFILALLFASVAINAQHADIYVPGEPEPEGVITTPPISLNSLVLPAPVLYDNGPLITHPGGGFGGADLSVLQSNLSMNVYGFGFSSGNVYKIADDFTVPEGGWDVKGFVFYAYQTFSTTTSTINDVRLIVYDGDPSDPLSNIVFGDPATNRYSASSFSNIYRALSIDPGSTARPIMEVLTEPNLQLPEGEYWVEVQVGGTLSSGPWAPPITILDQTTTGDALQYQGSDYQPLLDSGTNTQQGLPFLVLGTPTPPEAIPLSGWAVWILGGLITMFVLLRIRRVL